MRNCTLPESTLFRALRTWARAFGINGEQTLQENARAYLGPDAEMGVGDELGSFVLSVMRLQKDVQHAHSHPGERDEVGKGPPHASCRGARRLRPAVGARPGLIPLPLCLKPRSRPRAVSLQLD